MNAAVLARMPLSRRFTHQVSVGHPGGCWLWIGSRRGKGYGRTFANGHIVLAHRVAYELFVGPIPEAMVIDHLCRNPSCVNPDHLEAVTMRENTLRGVGPSAVNAAKASCRRGHPLDDANVYVSGGRRHCRACRHARGAADQRAFRARRRAAEQVPA
jgi:hypothetical protein